MGGTKPSPPVTPVGVAATQWWPNSFWRLTLMRVGTGAYPNGRLPQPRHGSTPLRYNTGLQCGGRGPPLRC
jgi:hypothetical protein